MRSKIRHSAIAIAAAMAIGVTVLAPQAYAVIRTNSTGGCEVKAEASLPSTGFPKGYTQAWGGAPGSPWPKCSSLSIASVYRKSDGSVFRTTYATGYPGVGFSAVAPYIPTGTTYLRGQLKICPKVGACVEYGVNP